MNTTTATIFDNITFRADAVSNETNAFEAQLQLRNAFVKAWRSDAKQNAAAHAAYAMIRGKSMAKTFSPLQNPIKIAAQNGEMHRGRDEAIYRAKIGFKTAWAWAAVVLKEIGLEHDRYGCYGIRDNAIMASWIAGAALETNQWEC